MKAAREKVREPKAAATEIIGFRIDPEMRARLRRIRDLLNKEREAAYVKGKPITETDLFRDWVTAGMAEAEDHLAKK